ncbi:MAG: rod shape-determining protein MreD [Tissierellia bacterium]|nr:rod shape-determining protein MreD [Tissierellia bacterium]
MKYIIICLGILINFIFQSTLLHMFSIYGVIPNTALILVNTFALLGGKKTGGTVGLFAGLLQDVFFGGVIGINAFIYFIIGYSIGILDEKVFKENLFLPFITVVVSTFVYHIVYYLFMTFLSIEVSFTIMAKNILVKEILYNSILSIFIYKKALKSFNRPHIKFTKKF